MSSDDSALKTNHVSLHPAGYFSKLYRDNDLTGAHVIMLGPKNDEAAEEALAAWPKGLQVGGGISDKNARDWIEKGAEKVGAHAFHDRSETKGGAQQLKCALVGHYHILPLPGG